MNNQKRSISFLNQMPPECIVLAKLFKFNQNKQHYKFKAEHKWGTKKDWKLYLYNDYKSSFPTNFIDMLIEIKVLVENNRVMKGGIDCTTYKLSKDWADKVRENIIHPHPFIIFLEDTCGYSITY